MEADAQVTFAGLLRELRTSARVSQRGLAEAAGLSFRTVSDLERGVATTPQKDTVRLLADALHLTGPARTRFESVARGRDESAQAAAATRTLPRDIGSFTGRQQELDRLIEAAANAAGAVGIHAIGGMAGVGKTAFAVHAAHRLADRFPHGQVFLPLHGHTPGYKPVDPEDALASLLLIMGVLPGHIPLGLTERTALWRDRLAGQRVLLILDDAVDSEQVEPLLPGSSGSLVLVTSRRHLSALDDVTTISLDTLPADEAAALLVRLTARPGLSPGDPAVAELVRLCGSLPLAIGMIARQLHHHPAWSLARRAAELASARDRLELMATENVSVAAALDLSYAELDPDVQRLFRRLGLHPCSELDTYSAAALDGTDLATASRGLEALYDHYLLTEPSQGRYRLHDLVREHSRTLAGHLDEDGDVVLTRVLDYYEHTAARANSYITRFTVPGAITPPAADVVVPDIPDSERALSWLRTERGSLLACLDVATAAGQHRRVIALTAALAGLLWLDGPWVDAIDRHAAAAAAAERLGDQLAEANALVELGGLQTVTGGRQAAAQALEQAVGLYRRLHDRLGEANVLADLGPMHSNAGDYQAAAQELEQARGLYRELGSWLGEANALNRLGAVLFAACDFTASVRAHRAALQLYGDLDDRHGQARALLGLGAVRYAMGDYPAATSALGQALQLSRDLGDRLGQANTLTRLGVVRHFTGDYVSAAQALDEALRLYRDLGNQIGQANALTQLGVVWRLTGDYPAASRALEEALRIARNPGYRLSEANALYELGIIRRLTGDLPTAARTLAESLAIYRSIDHRFGEANVLAESAALRRLDGDFPDAVRDIEQAIATFRDLGNRRGEAQALNEEGTLYLLSGDLEQATRCHHQAREHARAIAIPLEEAQALAGLGRCALAAGDGAQARTLLRQALDTLERLGSADAADLRAELGALSG